VRQVREADVLKQKAYMLFYVRDSIGNPVVRRDNSTANLPTKKTPEKNSTLNGITQSSVKAQHLNGSSSFGDKTHNTSSGYILGKSSAGHFSKNEVKAEDVAASQSNASLSAQTLGSQNNGASLHPKSMQCSVNGQKAVETKGNAGGNTSVASPMVNGVGTLSNADKLTSQPPTTLFSKPAAHMNDTSVGFAAQTPAKKVCPMMLTAFFY
jgi:ubiquitin carboxyl-terminal hydrolase 36/42